MIDIYQYHEIVKREREAFSQCFDFSKERNETLSQNLGMNLQTWIDASKELKAAQAEIEIALQNFKASQVG